VTGRNHLEQKIAAEKVLALHIWTLVTFCRVKSNSHYPGFILAVKVFDLFQSFYIGNFSQMPLSGQKIAMAE
jgi:hypothetical protein